MSVESDTLLLLDEDVWVGLAAALQDEGYDVVFVSELGRKGISDADQLAYAVSNGRAIITHNVGDFIALAKLYFEQEDDHYGIIIAPHLEKGALLRRVLQLLQTTTRANLMNSVRFA